MKKSTTLWLLGGGLVALYLYSQSQSQAGQGQQGQGQLPSGGQGGNYGQMGFAAPRPRFRW